MRDIIIGDIHLDMKHGDSNFLIYQDLFFNQLYKYLETHNDIRYVIFLGDIFTNKQIINVNVMDYSLKTFETISKYGVKIIMINGNHVIYHKNSYELDSVDVVFRDRSNLNIQMFKDYLQIDNYLFFNWRDTKEEYVELFEQIKKPKSVNYIFGHFDLFGFMHTRFAENNNKSSLREDDIYSHFSNLTRVISGHYHMPQDTTKILYTGVPYELSWNEAGLNLGFYIIDEDGEFEFIKNKHCMYESIHIKTKEDIENYSIIDLPYSKYIKIIYDSKDLDNEIEELKLKLHEKGHKITVINNYDLFTDTSSDLTESDLRLVETNSKTNNVEMNLGFIFKDYIYKLNLKDDIKDNVYTKFIAMYEETKLEITQNFEI